MNIPGLEDTISQLLETISKPARIQILLAIGTSEACVCHLETILGLRQAYISQHLMVLRKAKMLNTRREGRYVFYQLGDKRLLDLINNAGAIAGISEAELDRLTQSQPIPQCCCPHCIEQLTPLPDRVNRSLILNGEIE